MIKNKPLDSLNRITAFIISVICISAGSIGLFLSIYNYQSIFIPISATGFIFIGIMYGITAYKGKPIDLPRLNKKFQKK